MIFNNNSNPGDKLNRDTITKNKDCFEWWMKTDMKCWVKKEGRKEWNLLKPEFAKGFIYVQNDEYAELRKAQIDGKTIQFKRFEGEWEDVKQPRYADPPQCYRIKPERWRAEKDQRYYYINSRMEITQTSEFNQWCDDGNYIIGNYFKTEAEAKKIAERFKKILEDAK